MFAPDALFYGTLSPELVTAPEGVLQYFTTALSGPAVVKAIPLSATTMALTENIVLISGSWQTERVLDGKTTLGAPLRMSAVLHKRGERWLVVQFHNSPRPAPPAPAPAK